MVSPANLNTPKQIVISGATEPVARAAALCKEKGAKRTVMLPVSAPFHCALMQPAQEGLATHLESVAFADPNFTVICNVDARAVKRGPDARDTLIRQVTGAGPLGGMHSTPAELRRDTLPGGRPRQGAHRPEPPDRPFVADLQHRGSLKVSPRLLALFD